MKSVFCAAALCALVGCSPTRYKPLCPPLVHYTAQEQQQAAEELRAHPDLHELPAMLRDYGNERREMGRCQMIGSLFPSPMRLLT